MQSLLERISKTVMPKPRIRPCEFCGREFTVHSIQLHLKRCVEKPLEADSRNERSKSADSRKSSARKRGDPQPERQKTAHVANPRFAHAVHVLPQPTVGDSDEEKGELPIKNQDEYDKPISEEKKNEPISELDQDHGDSDSVSPSRASAYDGSDRPNTTTLSSDQKDFSSGGPRGSRICYVCGQRFGRSSIALHEKKCLQIWTNQAQRMAKFIKVTPPQKTSIPSVDGTVDASKMDAEATQSFKKAQKADCMKCGKTIQFSAAIEHGKTCTKYRKQGDNWRTNDSVFVAMY